MKIFLNIRVYLLVLPICFSTALHSQNVVDCIMNSGSCPGVRVSLLPLIEANDSLSKVYINQLMNYIEIEAVDGVYSGYTIAEVREIMRISSSVSFDELRWVPRGVVAMYLIYTIILKDSAFCHKIFITKKHKNKLKGVAFYKLPDKKRNGSYYVGEFIGRKHLRKMVKIFRKWHKNNSDKSILLLKDNLPFKGTAYNFSGLK